MFLGSNSVRHLNAAVFSHWPYLEYLTLENIIVDDVAACLELIGKQLKGLKIQCAGKKEICKEKLPFTLYRTRANDNRGF